METQGPVRVLGSETGTIKNETGTIKNETGTFKNKTDPN